MELSSFIILVTSVIVSYFLWNFLSRRTPKNKGTRLVPGPPGKPIIGNLPDIPDHHSWLKFKEWSDTYGPIFRLDLAGQQHVVLSTEKIANDLLRERGSKYSSRPYLPMAQGILSRNMRPVFLPYNDVWRNGRRLMHHLTMNAVATTYEPVQDAYSKRYLRELLHDPSGYQKWFELFAAAVVFKLAFDKTIVTGDENEIKRIVNVVRTLEKVASPGAYLVDIIPALMYLPKFLADFKRQGDRWHEEEVGLFRQLQNDVKKDMARGLARNSFTRTFLESQAKYNLSDDEGAYVVGTLFEAGSGTAAAALMSFILAMCHHPEWQDKMHREIDERVGERMPEFEDIPNLPTVRAVIKEVMRWRPVTAGGLPHMLVEDDVYDGYFFKAGTVFHPNQWAIHREPELYPDPESYRPDRWLDPSFPTYREPLTVYPNLHNFSSFGFGRRICPGQNIASRSLNIMVARIGWACHISKKKTSDGTDIMPPLYDYTRGFNAQPNPFVFSLEPRSKERMEAVESAYAELERLRKDGGSVE